MQAILSLDAIERVETLSLRKKVYRHRSDPFSLDDEDFRKRYRFNKSTARFIIDLIRDDLTLDRRGCGTSPEIQVLTAIRCWGRREVQEDAGDHHGLSQATTSRICARVARALARHSSSFIKMPCTLAEQEKVMREFHGIKNFPNVIGCIGCTQIKIKKCGGDEAQDYVNRKGFYSLNVQVTCDAQLRIRDIVAKWRGSTHDARIFRESSLKERFERGLFKGVLLGDSGYTLEPYLFTPLVRTQNSSEERYNEAHISTRNTVEQCFGVWKRRFPCLLYGMSCKLGNVKTTMYALAVLHNIAIDRGDIQLEDTVSNIVNEEVQDSNIRGSANADAIIKTFIRRHFN